MLRDLENFPATGPSGPKFNQLVKSLQDSVNSKEWLAFVSLIHSAIICTGFSPDKKKKGSRGSVVFTSAWRESMQRSVNSGLCDSDIRAQLLDALNAVQVCDKEVAWPFLSQFCKSVGCKALSEILRKIKVSSQSSNSKEIARSTDNYDLKFNQQTVHMISGAIVRGYIRKSYSFKHNAKLQRFKDVLLSRVASMGTQAVSDPDNLSLWTSTINRKSLIFVHTTSLPFFVEVVKLIQKVEKADGSIHHDRVRENVYKATNIMDMWDGMIQDSLSHKESEELMFGLIKSLTNTCGRGVLLKHTNMAFVKAKGKKALNSCGHRATLTR